MKVHCNLKSGHIILTNAGPVCVIEKLNSRYTKIIFLEPPYSISTVQNSNLLRGMVANRSNSPVCKKPAEKKHPKTIDGQATPVYSLWHRIKSDCRRGAEMFSDWRDFDTFADWCHAQPQPETDQFRWIFTHQFFDLENDWYAPETCHILPEPLVRTVLRSSNPATIRRSVEHHKRWILPDLYDRMLQELPQEIDDDL